jgi:hypothetical protein
MKSIVSEPVPEFFTKKWEHSSIRYNYNNFQKEHFKTI